MVSFRARLSSRVEKEQEFEELKGAIDRAFAAERVEKFLKRLRQQAASGYAISKSVLARARI